MAPEDFTNLPQTTPCWDSSAPGRKMVPPCTQSRRQEIYILALTSSWTSRGQTSPSKAASRARRNVLTVPTLPLGRSALFIARTFLPANARLCCILFYCSSLWWDDHYWRRWVSQPGWRTRAAFRVYWANFFFLMGGKNISVQKIQESERQWILEFFFFLGNILGSEV